MIEEQTKVDEYLNKWFESSDYDLNNIETFPDEIVYEYFDLQFEVILDEDIVKINLYKNGYDGIIELDKNIESKFVLIEDLKKYVIHTEDFTLELNSEEYATLKKFLKAYYIDGRTIEESFMFMIE